MRKLNTVLISACLSLQTIAQPTLTQGFNEPTAGNSYQYALCDSTAPIPRSTGSGQYWDFSSIAVSLPGWTTQPLAHTYSYTSPTGKPNAPVFPAATMAEGTNYYYNYFRSVSTPTQQLELLGTSVSQSTLVMSDPKIVMKWPMSFGNSFSDGYAGTRTYGMQNLAFSGTINVTASGTGTLELPGGQVFSNVLQVITTDISGISGNYGMAYAPEKFDYFISGTSEPLLSVIKMDHIGADTLMILWNNSVVTALKETQTPGFEIFPNPAEDRLVIAQGSVANKSRTIILSDVAGKKVKMVKLPAGSKTTTMDLTGLVPGVYLLQLENDDGISTKKIVIH